MPTQPNAEILQLALAVVQECEVGLLSTVDESGRPHARWMGSVAKDEDVSWIITIASPNSRKIDQIRCHPDVEWIFTDSKWDRVVHLRGRAILIEDPALIKRDWNRILDKSRAYFLRFQETGLGFSVIETHIEEIEYTLPKINVFHRHRLVP